LCDHLGVARTHKADYNRSNRIRTISLPDVREAAGAARRLLAVRDATSRRLYGQQVLAALARQTGITVPELVVPDDPQPHRRARGRIVYSQQGEYRRRQPSQDDPRVARGGKALGRIRMHNRTPARAAPVRADAFLHTMLHEFCHHHDDEGLRLLQSFHTAGFFARVRHLREQLQAGVRAATLEARREEDKARLAADGPQTTAEEFEPPTGLERLWSIIRNL
jgi:hypothetical protein